MLIKHAFEISHFSPVNCNCVDHMYCKGIRCRVLIDTLDRYPRSTSGSIHYRHPDHSVDTHNRSIIDRVVVRPVISWFSIDMLTEMLMECQSRTIANRGGMVYRSFSNYLCTQNWGKLLLWWKMLLVFKIFLHNMAASQKYNCCMTLGNCPFMNHKFMFNFQANNPQSTSGSILNRHPDDTWSTLYNSQSIIGRASTSSYAVYRDVDGVSIKCQLRCWWSVDQYQLRVDWGYQSRVSIDNQPYSVDALNAHDPIGF